MVLFHWEIRAQSNNPKNQDSAGIVSNRPQAGLRFTPFIAPVVSPEVQLMITAGGLLTFGSVNPDRSSPRSSVPFSVGYSTNNSLVINVRPSIYLDDNMYRVQGVIWVRDMPSDYWGVGYKEAQAVERSDSITGYQRLWWEFDFNLLRQVASHLYAGIHLHLNRTKATDLSERMKQDPNVINEGTDNRNSGLGIVIRYDRRDIPVNAYSGIYMSFAATYYGRLLNGQNQYQTYAFDIRKYLQINRPGRTFATQLSARIATNGVPWPELSQIGTPFDLRAYVWGQYRDRQSLFLLTEYRHMFSRKAPDRNGSLMSRHGVVIWLGTGTVTRSPNDFKGWLPNGGLGYRFEVQPRMNARVDFGVGKNTSGLYISFNEAF